MKSYDEYGSPPKALGNIFPIASKSLAAAILLTLPGGVPVAAGEGLDVTGTIGLDFVTQVNGGEIEIHPVGGLSTNLTWTTPAQLLDVSLRESAQSGPLRWGDPFIWNDLTLAFANTLTVITTLRGVITDTIATLIFEHPVQTLRSLGPTEQSLAVTPFSIRFGDNPDWEFSVGVSVPVKFNVTLNGGGEMTIDQSPVVLENLTINGDMVTHGGALQVRQALANSGTVEGMSAAVGGDFSNNGMFSSPGLSVGGLFTNEGTLHMINGTLSHSKHLTNAGTLRSSGSVTISAHEGMTNEGQVEILSGVLRLPPSVLSSGEIKGNGELFASPLTVSGTLQAEGAGESLTLYSSLLHNHGVVGSRGGAVLILDGGTIHNHGSIVAGGEVKLVNCLVNGGKLIGPGPVTVQGNGATFIGVANDAPLRVLGTNAFGEGTTLSVDGGAFENNGLITVRYGDGPRAALVFGGNTLLSGGGEVFLNTATLRVASGTLTANQPIYGAGTVTGSLELNSNLTARGLEGDLLHLNNVHIVNRAVIASEAPTALEVSGVVRNEGGSLVAGGPLALTNSFIEGGAVRGGRVRIQGSGATFKGVTATGVIDVMGSFVAGEGTTLSVDGGAFVNHSHITVRAGDGPRAALVFDGNTVMSGAGNVFLRGGTLRVAFGALTSQQPIHGYGSVSGGLVLHSPLMADVTGETLTLEGGMVENHSRLGAVGGAVLSVNGGSIDNTGGVIAPGGEVSLTNCLVNGGRIAAGGPVRIPGGAVTFTGLINEAPVLVMGSSGAGTSLTINGGSLVNHHRITVREGDGPLAALVLREAGHISGNGEILLRDAVLRGGTLTLGAAQTLRGSGIVSSPVNCQGILSPGLPVGSLEHHGALTLQPSARLKMELDAGGFDRVTATAPVMLGGQLVVVVLPGLQSRLTPADSFRIIHSSAGVSGAFANVASGERLETNFGSCVVTVDATGVTLSGFQGGQPWRSRHFSETERADESVSGDTADPDGDGLSNKLEYALGTDPRSYTDEMLRMSIGPDGAVTLSLTTTPEAGETALLIRTSPNLATWLPVDGYLQTVTVGPITEERRLTLPGGVEMRRFFQVTAPPP